MFPEGNNQPKLWAPAGQNVLQASSLSLWLTNSPEEVSILGKGHEGLRQLPQPLLQDPSDGMDGEVFQVDCSRVCRQEQVSTVWALTSGPDQWARLGRLLLVPYLSAVPVAVPVSG